MIKKSSLISVAIVHENDQETVLKIIVYWLEYGTNSLIWLDESQSTHRRTDRRMDRATQ